MTSRSALKKNRPSRKAILPALPTWKGENRQLKAQVAELQKRVQELEAEQKAAACRSRAKKLLTRLEKQGLSFASEEDREAERTSSPNCPTKPSAHRGRLRAPAQVAKADKDKKRNRR